MKKKGLLMVLFLFFILSIVSYAVAESQIDTSKIHFYIYGMKTCPHCHRMKEEIPKIYGKNSLTYYELVGNDENNKLFGELYQLTGIRGVPVIAIAYNGTLYAVIEGEFNVSAAPLIIKEAQKNGGLILVVGGKAYLIKNQTHIQMLETIFIKHNSVFKQSTSTSSSSSSTSTSISTNSPHTSTRSSTSGSTTSNSAASSIAQSKKNVCGPALFLLLTPFPLILRKKR